MLSLDWNLLFTVINLVIFYILMKKFVWNKVLGAMDKRQSKIDQQFKDADEDRRAAGALKTEYEELHLLSERSMASRTFYSETPKMKGRDRNKPCLLYTSPSPRDRG